MELWAGFLAAGGTNKKRKQERERGLNELLQGMLNKTNGPTERYSRNNSRIERTGGFGSSSAGAGVIGQLIGNEAAW